MCRTTGLIFLLVSSLLAIPLQAQVTARQGSAAEEMQEFESPMLLDLELPNLALLSVGESHTFSGLRRFVCDDASVPRLLIKKPKQKKRGDKVEFHIEGTVYVRESHDRFVYLEFRIVQDDQPQAIARVSKLEVEEAEAKSFHTRLLIDREQLEHLFSADAEPKLTILVSVRDNT